MEHGTRASYVRGCRCAACTAAERDYQAARRLRLRAAKGAVESDPDVQAEPELGALDDLPLLKPFGQLPDGRLVLTDVAGALYIASSIASFLEDDDSDEPCPTCGLVHEVLDDEEAPGDGDQEHERHHPTTGTPKPESASTAEAADATLHTHQHKPDGIPMHHAHDGGDKPHQHKAVRKTVTTTSYRPPKGAPTPKVAAKATAKSKVPTQVAPVRTPAKSAPRRPIVTTAWHAHRMAGAPDERKGER
jgi:hypothetical protein